MKSYLKWVGYIGLAVFILESILNAVFYVFGGRVDMSPDARYHAGIFFSLSCLGVSQLMEIKDKLK